MAFIVIKSTFDSYRKTQNSWRVEWQLKYILAVSFPSDHRFNNKKLIENKNKWNSLIENVSVSVYITYIGFTIDYDKSPTLKCYRIQISSHNSRWYQSLSHLPALMSSYGNRQTHLKYKQIESLNCNVCPMALFN